MYQEQLPRAVIHSVGKANNEHRNQNALEMENSL